MRRAARRAFELAAKKLPGRGARLTLLPRDKCGLPVLDRRSISYARSRR